MGLNRLISSDNCWSSFLWIDQLLPPPGGGSGIGRAVCQRLASEGASVVVADISEESANETLASLQSDLRGQGHMAAVVDVSSKESIKKLVTDIQVRNRQSRPQTLAVILKLKLFPSLCRLGTSSLPQCVWTQQESPETTSCWAWRRSSSTKSSRWTWRYAAVRPGLNPSLTNQRTQMVRFRKTWGASFVRGAFFTFCLQFKENVSCLIISDSWFFKNQAAESSQFKS